MYIYMYIYESICIFAESMHALTGVVEHYACAGVYVRQMLWISAYTSAARSLQDVHMRYVYTCVYAYVYVYTYVRACMYIYMYVCIYVYMHNYMDVYMCVCVCICICVCVCMYMYVYIYMYMSIFVNVYKVHMCINMLRGGMRSWTNCFFLLTCLFFWEK